MRKPVTIMAKKSAATTVEQLEHFAKTGELPVDISAAATTTTTTETLPTATEPVEEVETLQLSSALHEKGGLKAILVNPARVLCIAEHNFGRVSNHTREDVSSLIANFLAVGQLDPCDVVKTTVAEHGKEICDLYDFEAVNGFGRTFAACVINEEGLRAEPFQLLVIVRNWDLDQRITANITSNRVKGKEYTVVDQAKGFKALRERGYTVKQVALMTGCDTSWVASAEKIAELPADILAVVANGDIPSRAACDMAFLPPKYRDQLLERYHRGELKKITKSDTKNAHRKAKMEGADKEINPETGEPYKIMRHSLVAADIEKYFDSWITGDNLDSAPVVATFSVEMIEFLRGFTQENEMGEFLITIGEREQELMQAFDDVVERGNDIMAQFDAIVAEKTAGTRREMLEALRAEDNRAEMLEAANKRAGDILLKHRAKVMMYISNANAEAAKAAAAKVKNVGKRGRPAKGSTPETPPAPSPTEAATAATTTV